MAASAYGATFYLTVAGLGGEPEYEQRFASLAKETEKLLKTGMPDATVETLSGPQATKANIERVLRGFASKAAKDDTLVVMLIGHGSFDGSDYKFELPGPDLSATELAALLDRIPAEKQLVVNMTSASGGSLVTLQRENRAVIVATKSGMEKNATSFSRFWVEALRDPTADTDKNESVSALEAFRFAEQKTAKHYETQNRLATEHALLEDTGHGDGTRSPSPATGEGLLAGRITLIRIGAAQAQARTPEKQALYKRKEDLEQKIDTLKYQKASLPEAEYKKQLQALLFELAKVQAEIDQ